MRQKSEERGIKLGVKRSHCGLGVPPSGASGVEE
jgi:hypothetical protein